MLDDRPRPRWLEEKIERNARKCRPEPCPRCGWPTLVGPDDDRIARIVRVDAPARNLEPIIAVMAHLMGLEVCRLWNRTDLVWLDDFELAGPLQFLVAVEHRCPTR
jgi:hypothetical protein